VARGSKRSGETIRYRMTAVGWVVIAFAGLVCIAAVNMSAGLLFWLFGALVGSIVASAFMGKRMLSAVKVSRDMPSRAWQHQVVHVGYTLRNVRRRGACLGLNVEEVAPIGIECASGYCVHLPAATAFRSGGRFTAHRRGRIKLQAIRLGTIFPMGLLDMQVVSAIEGQLVVWPARGKLRNNILQFGAVNTSRSAPSRVRGGQDEFFGLRDYRNEDSPRWIHWRRSAQKGELVVREMVHPLPEMLWVVVDTYIDEVENISDTERERLIRFAATLVDAAISKSFLTGMVLSVGGRIVVFPPSDARDQQRILLDALADIDANCSHRLEEVVTHLTCKQIANSRLVIVNMSAKPLGADVTKPLDRCCRNVTVVNSGNCSQFFHDVAVSPREAPCR
jgi:uncharacterized protein (DUF58 family)